MPRRQRTHPATAWQFPACEECQRYGIEAVRTSAGWALWEHGVSLHDISAQIETSIVACDHSPLGDWLTDKSPADQRAAGLRTSIRVWTRRRPVLADDGSVIATSSAWTDEGVYIQ